MHKQLKKTDFFLIFIQFTVFGNCLGAAMDPLAGRVFEVPDINHMITISVILFIDFNCVLIWRNISLQAKVFSGSKKN